MLLLFTRDAFPAANDITPFSASKGTPSPTYPVCSLILPCAVLQVSLHALVPFLSLFASFLKWQGQNLHCYWIGSMLLCMACQCQGLWCEAEGGRWEDGTGKRPDQAWEEGGFSGWGAHHILIPFQGWIHLSGATQTYTSYSAEAAPSWPRQMLGVIPGQEN